MAGLKRGPSVPALRELYANKRPGVSGLTPSAPCPCKNAGHGGTRGRRVVRGVRDARAVSGVKCVKE